MRRLLNTLYVTRKDAYLSLDGENIVVKVDGKEIARFPLHTLDSIIVFSYQGASPTLMGKCSEKGITISFCSQTGRFLCRTVGTSTGNVLLRREQYHLADEPKECVNISKMFLFGKIYNARGVVERAIRDHSLRVDIETMKIVSKRLHDSLHGILTTQNLDTLRGIEGKAASGYFGVFDQMILRNKDTFKYIERSRRPPLDECNALLSFIYILLMNMCMNSLEAVGLDSYVGFLHKDRPGRTSLALDLMEELRACMADRFVLTLINNRIVSPNDFIKTESGAVLIRDEARKVIIQKWQERKEETITHPFIKEKIPWGLVPYVQAQLLARYIRNDIESYPPFLWK